MRAYTVKRFRLLASDVARQMNVGGYRALLLLLRGRSSSWERVRAVSSAAEGLSDTRLGARLRKLTVRHAVQYLSKRKPETHSGGPQNQKLQRSIIAKLPCNDERGLLLLNFDNELEKILTAPGFREIEKRYAIGFFPSWKGLMTPALALLAAKARKAFFVMPPIPHERRYVKDLGPHAHPLPFNAASWISSCSFEALSFSQKDIPLIMVANFAGFKRHWLLFAALRDLPQPVTATLVGVPLAGRTAKDLRSEARAFGVEGRINIIEEPTQSRLRELLARSQLFCAFSHREGSYIAASEAMMAGTPVLAFRNAQFGSRYNINESNGFLLRRWKNIGSQILESLEIAAELNPRSWAKEHLSSERNVERLGDEVSRCLRAAGEPFQPQMLNFVSKRLSFYYTGNNLPINRVSEEIEWFERMGLSLPPVESYLDVDTW